MTRSRIVLYVLAGFLDVWKAKSFTIIVLNSSGDPSSDNHKKLKRHADGI